MQLLQRKNDPFTASGLSYIITYCIIPMKVKQKTHKGASKRFRVTKNGKVMHRSIKLRHLRHVKGKRNTRRLKLMKQIKGTFAKKLKKILAIK